jgi:hypothetical protein
MKTTISGKINLLNMAFWYANIFILFIHGKLLVHSFLGSLSSNRSSNCI